MSSWRAFFRRSITSRRLASSLAMTTGRVQLSSCELFEVESGISSRLELEVPPLSLRELEEADFLIFCFVSLVLLEITQSSGDVSLPDKAQRASPPLAPAFGLFSVPR